MSVKNRRFFILIITETAADSEFPAEFPASEAFDAINEALKDEAQRKDAIKQAAGVYAFTLTNKAGKEASWHIDLKSTGKVGTGAAPAGGKADGAFILW